MCFIFVLNVEQEIKTQIKLNWETKYVPQQQSTFQRETQKINKQSNKEGTSTKKGFIYLPSYLDGKILLYSFATVSDRRFTWMPAAL